MEEYVMNSPVGPLRLRAAQGALVGLSFGGSPTEAEAPTQLLQRAARQLEEYFQGARRTFDLPLAPQGTPFQQAVWQVLQEIPYGETWTYGAVAAAVGRPRGAQAVGQAIGRNPIAILIPCHRVIGKDGTLTGFAGGLQIKGQLLGLEGLQGI